MTISKWFSENVFQEVCSLTKINMWLNSDSDDFITKDIFVFKSSKRNRLSKLTVEKTNNFLT